MQKNAIGIVASMNCHESYRNVNWDGLLSRAEHSLHIVVYFWDKWVRQHEKQLTKFLQKPNAKIHFFFSNQLEEVQKLFPNNSVDQLSEKIQMTYQPLQDYLRVHQLPLDKVSVHFLPRLLNYSLQCVDESMLVLSFFEMYRKEQVDSPALVIDLKQVAHVQKFYQKELQGLKHEASAQSVC